MATRVTTGFVLITPRSGTSFPQPVESFTATAVTPGASNVEGSWTEISAATAAEGNCLMLCIVNGLINSQNTSMLIDVSTGSAGNEGASIVASNLCNGGGQFRLYPLLVDIPLGTRLSVRAQSANAAPVAANIRATLCMIDGLTSPSSVVTMGDTQTATSRGVSVASTNTWVEVEDSTAASYQAVVLTYGHNGDTSQSGNAQDIVIGTGAVGQEVAVASFRTLSSTSEGYSGHWGGLGTLIPGPFPAGTRFTVKGSNAATDQLDVVLLGVPYA